MRKDKVIAIEMRKNGKSYRQIRSALKIPLSTLSGWFAEAEWSVDVKKKLIQSSNEAGAIRLAELDKIRGKHLARAYETAKEEAIKEFETLKYNPVFIAGIMLYWGEGDKLTKQSVKLTNTDPEMIKLFVYFLIQVLKIPKSRVRLQILLYPDLDDWLCRAYWYKASGLSASHFTKSTVIQGKHKTRRLSFGICMVTVSSTYLKVKMLEWMNLLPKELMNQQYYENIASEATIV
jgi:hypothetical protein